ncbi:MAG: hypothetical protein M3P24_11965, partial [Gemmatimonadota bacterium]|nr:hypothetical protein [Gemmatimonadota bacterium]
MDPLQVVVQIHESDEPSSAFRTMVAHLAARLPLRAVLWRAPDGAVREAWPEATAGEAEGGESRTFSLGAGGELVFVAE